MYPFLRQLSNSRNWAPNPNNNSSTSRMSNNPVEIGSFLNKKMDMHYGNNCNGIKKRVMVVVDDKSYTKHAMIWALTHVANKGDLLTLLHIIPPFDNSSEFSPCLAKSLGSLCKACKPEVEVEALVIEGPKLATVINQVKKLDVAVLVLGQNKPSPFVKCLCGSSSSEEFVEQCIENVECLTIGVSKQSKSVGGYLITTRWHKNFWLLA